MKLIANVENKTLRILENERSIFRGEYGADKLELYINKQLENEYPTITALLSNGRKIGPYSTDDAYITEEIDGEQYTKATFTLSKANGFTLSEGKMQITIWMNNSSRKTKQVIGNLLINVINTTAFDGGDIIISGDVEGAVVNLKLIVEDLQGKMITNEDKTEMLNRLSKLEKEMGVISLGEIGDPYDVNNEQLNSVTNSGVYTFTSTSRLSGGYYINTDVYFMVVERTDTDNRAVEQFIYSCDIYRYIEEDASSGLTIYRRVKSKSTGTWEVTSIKLPSQEYVDTKINELIDGSPEALNTLKELSEALNNDENFATNVLNKLGAISNISNGEGESSIAQKNNLATGFNSSSFGFDNIVIDENDNYVYNVTITTLDGNIVPENPSTPGDEDLVTQEPVNESYLDGTQLLPYLKQELNTTGADGAYSHSEGFHTLAKGAASHTEGKYTYAKGRHSHAEGYMTSSQGIEAHAEGLNNLSKGQASHTEGMLNMAMGKATHVEGLKNRVNGINSHAEGVKNIVWAGASHAEGYNNAILTNANTSHVEGSGNKVSSYDSHAEGTNNTVSGASSHVEGSNNIASGVNSHAGGNSTEASGEGSFTSGKETKANGKFSFAGGLKSEAGSDCSFAYGNQVKAPAWTGFAINYYTEAATSHSFVAGVHTKSSRTAQTVVGSSNNDNSNALFIVGNGDYTGATVTRKSNAFEVLKDGRAKSYGTPSEDTDVATVGFVTRYFANNSSGSGSGGSALYAHDLTIQFDPTGGQGYDALTLTFRIITSSAVAFTSFIELYDIKNPDSNIAMFEGALSFTEDSKSFEYGTGNLYIEKIVTVLETTTEVSYSASMTGNTNDTLNNTITVRSAGLPDHYIGDMVKIKDSVKGL